MAVIVKDGEMYLRLSIDGVSADMIWDEAKHFINRLGSMVPYRFMDSVCSPYTFKAE